MSPPPATIPVSVIGGFLGTGKTTLMNRLLAESPTRTAVLVNDFGEINVDAAILTSGDGLTFELANGCICCSMADGLATAIARAVAAAPDRILIETSGVGEPRRVAEYALLDPALHLDLVVTLADAANLPDQLEDPLVGDTVARQFDGADLILLNRVDMAGPQARDAARAALRRLAPGRPVIETVRAEIPAALLVRDEVTIFAAAPHGQHHAGHDRIFHPLTLTDPQPFDRAGLNRALGRLPRSLLRLKGWVQFTDAAHPQLLQWVQGQWEFGPEAADQPPASRLMAIASTPGLDLAALLRGDAG
ncbi:MAG: cobalamin synthesis protein, P47K [Tistrella sp.]|uniref:GTP-binding protein n=1 Tax=Tistrella mobilis TaxID=171437 RepID=A0A3B9IRS4_9PROT|nr:GTP-binding protein [Tistrella sp.]MAD36087.1 cobalamin synthesis protein, P47K [Tistrella sp.]MBA77577.1 cobalamin synthesis protein, P47K [Tistrella sp.]HAE49909.1 GTP-binding protein [Tistrella mobilis]